MKTLLSTEYSVNFNDYINLVKPEDDYLVALHDTSNNFVNFIESVPVDKHTFKYELDKWSVKDIVRHLIDTERIFAYRALRFARFDTTSLSGFEENDYARNVDTSAVPMEDLIKEFILVRKSNIQLFESFSDSMLSNKGIASGNELSVLAIGFIISGHLIHHQNIIKERYL